MKVYVYCFFAALLGTALAWGQTGDSPPSAEDGVEVLTRGPVHEAFAGTITFNPEPGVVAPQAPPEAIEELPPDQKPEGANVAWIPGYWAWDDERKDFLWISGIWRNLPPGRQWVPGYWGNTSEGAQWTSGYWADAAASEIQYLDEPPASVETGPNIAATSADQIWMPGCWLWNQNRYAWRPGYWSAGHQNWVWVPAYYSWTPRGYVFVDGYYDYAVANRGMLFAPVHFRPSIFRRRGFSYSPQFVINSAVFGSQLFLRPRYQHYYFGDYYSASYSNAGYYPWFSYNAHTQYHGYDPISAQQRWQNRDNREWEQRIQADYQHRLQHTEDRPPHTLAVQNSLVASRGSSLPKSFVVATPLSSLAKSEGSDLRLRPVARDARQKLTQHSQEVQRFRQERQKLETQAAVRSATKSTKPSSPVRITHSRSPLVSRAVDQLESDQAPPKRHEVLKPNLDVEPKPRVRTPQVDRAPLPPSKPQTSPQTSPQPRPKMDRPEPKRQPTPKTESPAKPRQGGPNAGPGPEKHQGQNKGQGQDKGQDKGKGQDRGKGKDK